MFVEEEANSTVLRAAKALDYFRDHFLGGGTVTVVSYYAHQWSVELLHLFCWSISILGHIDDVLTSGLYGENRPRAIQLYRLPMSALLLVGHSEKIYSSARDCWEHSRRDSQMCELRELEDGVKCLEYL